MIKLLPKTKNILLQLNSATIATCLYRKGLRNQFVQNVNLINKNAAKMVGQAFTLRYIPAREDLNPLSVFENQKHPQRLAIETCPEGFVLIMDSRKDARAASAGSILITRLMKRGAAGIVTDGGFRDVFEIEKINFPAYQQRTAISTNLCIHQAIDINIPIACGDVAVFPGDVVFGDADGVMIIPIEMAEEVAEECLQMTIFEEFVMEKVLEGRSILGLYPPVNPDTKIEFELWKNR
jgi:regulator of RNase E activity RraA